MFQGGEKVESFLLFIEGTRQRKDKGSREKSEIQANEEKGGQKSMVDYGQRTNC